MKRKNGFLCFMVMVTAALAGCGGGSSVSELPPITFDAHRTLRVLSGDSQVALSGTVLYSPIRVELTKNGSPLPNIPVTFEADPDLQILPNPAVTTSNGQVSVLVRLPDVPNKSFTVSLSAQGATSTTFTARTASRAVNMIGTPMPASAEVLDDGTLVLGSAVGTNGTLGVWVLDSNGKVRASSNPALRRFTVPHDRSYTPVQCRYPGRLAFTDGENLLITDLDLRIVQYVNIDAVGSTYSSGVIAVGPDGAIFIRTNNGIAVLDSSGQYKGPFATGHDNAGPGYVGSFRLTPSGTLVGISGDKVYEIRTDGTAVGSFDVPSVMGVYSQGSLYVAANGNIIVARGSEVFVYNSRYEQIDHLFALSENGTRLNGDLTVIGTDVSGNYYLSFQNNGPILRADATLKVTNRLVQDSGFHPLSLLPDPAHNRLLDLAGGTLFSSALERLGNWPSRVGGDEYAFDPNTGELYVTHVAYAPLTATTIDVYDSSRTLLRKLSFSQFLEPIAIAIDATSQKYIYERRTSTVHVLSSSDQYVRSIPAGSGYAMGVMMAVTPDGALLVGDREQLKKISSDGTVIWTRSHVDWLAVHSSGRIYTSTAFGVKVLDSSGNTLPDVPEYFVAASNPTILSNTLYLTAQDRIYAIEIP